MFNFNIKSLALILSLLIISSFGGWAIYAWTGPTSAPPGSNAPQPLNIGTTDQDKAARISAVEFYDADNSSFYINPSGNSSISGILTVGGDISDGAKTIYDSASGRLDYSVLPYHKGDLTSDWASNVDTSSYYDVSELSVGNVVTGVNFGRGSTGTNAGQACAVGTATVGDVSCGKTVDYDCDGVAESGTTCSGQGNVCSGGSCSIPSSACVGNSGAIYSYNEDIVSCAVNDMWYLHPVMISYNDGVTYCSNLNYAGFTDWHLPSESQLRAIYSDSANICSGYGGEPVLLWALYMLRALGCESFI